MTRTPDARDVLERLADYCVGRDGTPTWNELSAMFDQIATILPEPGAARVISDEEMDADDSDTSAYDAYQRGIERGRRDEREACLAIIDAASLGEPVVAAIAKEIRQRASQEG